MYARIASFEGGDTERLRRLNQERDEAGSANFPEGLRHAFALASGDGDRRLLVTLFDSREAIEAAEQRFEEMGEEIPEEVRGRRTSVEVYEVVIHEQPRDAAAARVSSLEGSPEQADEGVRYAEENVLPRARELAGWKGVLSMLDRESGRGKLITFWESAEAMQASAEQASQLREDSAQASGAGVRGVEQYNLVFQRSF
jgi:heme-degrading monooxygenase HmoA